MIGLLIAVVLFSSHQQSLFAFEADEVFGAAANPTGQPIGGGQGYSAGPKRDAAKVIVRDLETLRSALHDANEGDLIWIDRSVSIDFTGVQLEIPKNVTLASDRGEQGSLGALLFARHSGSEWFIQLRSGARLSGVRVRGSNPSTADVDQKKSDPPGYAVACANGRVDNCEISHFQRGGIALLRDSDHSLIQHNFLHDISAYPVFLGNSTGDGHVVEANRIEWAWHAVGCNGSRGCGYTVRFNEFVRVPRPKLYDQSGPSPPNWCLDVHVNDGAETRPPRPSTRKLIVHHNTFLAHANVQVGDGNELLTTNGIYPKHDIYVGPGAGMTTTIEIHHNCFLMHEKSGPKDKTKPFGRAIRLVGYRGDPAIEDDLATTKDTWRVKIEANKFSGKN